MTNNQLLKKMSQDMKMRNFSHYTYDTYKGKTKEMAPSKKVFGFNLKDESLRELELLIKNYFNEKLENKYKLEELWEIK